MRTAKTEEDREHVIGDNLKKLRIMNAMTVEDVREYTVLGTSWLNPIDVIEKKYVETDNEIIGYYSGTAFLNQIGISTQVPNLIEIYTNNESSRVRDVKVGRQQVRLRKSRVSVTNKNAATLALLEMMNSSQARQLDKKQREMCEQYIRRNGIKRSDVIEYSKYFPACTPQHIFFTNVSTARTPSLFPVVVENAGISLSGRAAKKFPEYSFLLSSNSRR